MTKKLTTDQFIEKAKEVHGDRYDYLKVVYVKAIQKVIIICKEHGEFEQTPSKHLLGGCKQCAMETLAIKKRSSTPQFIQKAKAVHGDNKYDYSKVVYVKAVQSIIIICKQHGEFYQTPNHHLTGYGCNKCGGRAKSNTQEFIEKAKEVHGDRYDYSKAVYIKSTQKIIIICKTHGEFGQQPSNHLSGQGCSKCANIIKGYFKRSNTQEFIENVKAIHGTTYDYSKVQYVQRNEKVIIVCNEHGEFEQLPSIHLMGCGCPKCAIIKNADIAKSNTHEFIEKAKRIHGDQYDYTKVEYEIAKDKVIIICKIHGEFQQTPYSHLSGRGCPKCAKSGGFSKSQIEWLEFVSELRNIKIQHAMNDGEHRIKSTKWKADGYCKETNTVFEYHGDYWHGNPNVFDPDEFNSVSKRKMKTLYANTIKREQKIKDLGYNLEVMWELDWNNVKKSIRRIQRVFRAKRSGRRE